MPPTSSACRLVSLSFCLLVFCVRYFLLFHQLAHDEDLMIFLQTSLFLVCPYAEDNCVPLSPKSSLTLSIILFLCLSLLLSPLTGILLWSRTGRPFRPRRCRSLSSAVVAFLLLLSAGHILTAWMVGQMSHHCPDLSHHWNVSHHRYYVVVLVWIYKKTGFYIF